MGTRHVVVDGSNLATEGRSMPSLAQLDEGVRSYMAENPDEEIIVVVDASFGYRIDESEKATFEEAEDAGEVVSPPAGAIGRGDGFLLRIADRVDATVLSNDSFQEFHGEYKWLFDEGRLIGGKPVPGVGWIFTPRTPVRGPKSRMATREAEKAAGGARGRGRGRSKAVSEPVVEAIAEATAEVVSPRVGDVRQPSEAGGAEEGAKSGRGSRRRPRSRSGAGPGPGTVNEPLPFITFIAEHHLGTEVEGVVEEFTSHGAFVTAGGARCYVPLVGLAKPAPRSAKEVLARGESRLFVVQALDAPRRGIELALPGLARVSGAPTEETVEAEIEVGASSGAPAVSEEDAPSATPAKKPGPTKTRTPAQKALAKKALAEKAAAKKGVPTGAAAAPVETARPKKTAPATKAATKKAAPKKAVALAKKAGPAKKAPAKKAASKASPPAKAALVTKAAPAKKVTAKKVVAKKVVAPIASAKRVSARKAPAKKSPAKKAPARNAPAEKAVAKKVGRTSKGA